MTQLRFDLRDLFRSARLGFSLQRMWLAFMGVGVGYGLYVLFTYLSFLVNGNSLTEMWNYYGLLPCLFTQESVQWYSWIVFFVGAVLLLLAYLITNTAIARASYMLLKGNNFYTWRESFAFAFRKAGSIISTPIAIVVMAALFVVGGLVIGLLARVIPFVGELGATLFTLFWFVAALVLFFLLLVLGVSLLLVPAIIATTDEDAFEAVFQCFSTIWSQPLRFIFYEVLIGLITIISTGIFAFIAKQSFVLMSDIFAVSWAFGDKFINIASHGQYLVQKWTFLYQNWISAVYMDFTPHLFFAREFYPIIGMSSVSTISAYFFAFSILAIGWWVESYGMAVFSVGQTLAYLNFRQKKDNENLLERKDNEEEEPEEEMAEKEDEQKEEQKSEEPAVKKRARKTTKKSETEAKTKKGMPPKKKE